MNNLMRRHFMGGKKSVDPTSTVFEVETNSPDQTFEITLFSDGNYNFEVDWGDGSSDIITTWNDANLVHNYSNTGNYDVVLTGSVDGIKVEGQAFVLGTASLKYIKQWGSTTNWAGFFNNRDLIEDLSIDIPVSFRGNSMQDFFRNCNNFTGGSNMENWDVSTVTNFFQCFRGSSFNTNIEGWDVSSATTLAVMFYDTPFNQPLNNWDVSSCLDFRAMFGITPFNQPLDLWQFNQTSFVSLESLFINSAFNNTSVQSWDMSRVNNIARIFQGSGCAFNQDISMWDVSNVTNMIEILRDNKTFNQDISAWNTASLQTLRNAFRNSNYNISLNGWDVSNCTDFYACFFQTNYNQPLDQWQISTTGNVNMFSMFRSCPFNQDITGWNMSAVNDLSWMFADNSNFNQNISTWQIRTTGNINFESMFRNATSFNKNISNWNTSAVSNMIEMFIGATSFNQDLSSWNINSLIDATNMFANTNLSTANYDALLIGWESQKPNIQQDVALGVGSTQYTLGGAAETARNNLIDPLQFNWTITDGGGI